MANDSKIVITAGLQIPETVNTITGDLGQVTDVLNKKHALKIVANIDLGKTTQRIQSQLATINKNLKIEIPKVDMGLSGGNGEIINDVEHLADDVEKRISELKQSLAKEFNVDIDKIITNTVKNAQNQITSFSFDLTKLNGEIEKFNYKVSRTKDGDNVVTAVKPVGSRDSDRGAIQLLERAAKAANTLERQMINLKAAADDVSAPRPITSQESIDKVAQAYKNAETAVDNLRTANASTFEELDSEAKKAVDELNNVIKAQRNADTAATKLRAKPIEVVKADELSNLDKFVATISNSAIPDVTNLTRRVEELRSELSEVNDKQGLVDYLNKFANVESDFKALVAQAKAVKGALRDLGNLSNNALFQKNMTNPEIASTLFDIEAIRKEYSQLFAEIGNAKTPEDLQKISNRLMELKPQFDKVTNSANQFKTALKLENIDAGQENRIRKLTDDINSYAAANQRATKSNKEMSNGKIFADEWTRIISEMAKGAELTDQEIKQLEADLRSFQKNAKSAGEAGATAFEKFAKSFKLVSTYISANQIINMAISKIREAVEELKNVDNILTEISKTSERSAESLTKLGNSSFETASKYGRTASDYLLGVQEMSRAGFGEVESENLAQLSLLAQSAGDMTAELANEYIIATNAAYGYQGSIEKLTSVLDSQNYVTNHYALNMSQLAEATKIAGSQAAQSGIGIDEMTAALATMISTTQQGGEIASRALRGILMNIQQVKGEVGDGEEDITAESLSKYEKAAAALGVSLKEVRNGAVALRDPMVVLNELADAYNKEADDSIKKANLISAIGGKYRGNQLSALLANWDTYKDILETYRSEKAVGSATEEAAKSANNWTGTLNQVKNAWTELVNEVVKSDAVIEVLNLVKEGLLDIKESGILEYVGDLVTVASKLIKPLKTLHDTFSKYTYGGMAKGLSYLADWLNKDKIEAEKAKRAIEEEKQMRESAVANVHSFDEEKKSLSDLVGEYVSLVSSTKSATEIRNGLTNIQNEIIDKYGQEADAIDLVNGKLSENIELLIKRENEENKAWLRDNNENIKNAKSFFDEAQNSGTKLSVFKITESDEDLRREAETEAKIFVGALKDNLEKLGVSDLINLTESNYLEEGSVEARNVKRYEFALKEGLTYEQAKEAIVAYNDAYNQMVQDRGSLADYFDVGGDRLDYVTDLFNKAIDFAEVYDKSKAIKSDKKIIDSFLGNEADLAKYESAIDKLTELNQIYNNTNETPASRVLASKGIKEQEAIIDSLILKYPALSDQAEAAMKSIGLSVGGLIADEQVLYDGFMESLDNAHKTALGNIEKLENAMASAIKGEGLTHDSAWEMLKLDTEGVLKPVIDSAGKYHFELEDIVKLKDSIIEKNKVLIEQDLEQMQLAKAEVDSNLQTLQLKYAQINAEIAQTSGNSRPSNSLVREQSTLRKQIADLEASSKAYGDEIKRDTLLIKEYDAHLGSLSDTEKMLTAETERLKKQQEQLKNEVDDLNKQADNLLKAQEAKIDGIIDGFEAEQDALEKDKELLEEQLDALKEQKDELEEIVDHYETIAGVVENTVSKQVEELERNRQSIEDYYNNLIEKLKEENDEREDALNYAQKLADLENAKNNKVMVYGSGTGWTYEVDQDALAKAQRALQQADTDKAVKELEKERDKATAEYDDRIKTFEEYAETWKDVSSEIKDEENELLAEQILGADWREKINSQDIELLEKYRNEYRSYTAQIKSLTDNEIKSLEASIKAKDAEIATKKKQIQTWKDYKNEIQNTVKAVKNSLEDYNKLLDGIALNENSTYEQRAANLTKFANKYSELMRQITDKNTQLDAATQKINNLSTALANVGNVDINFDDATDQLRDFTENFRNAFAGMAGVAAGLSAIMGVNPAISAGHNIVNSQANNLKKLDEIIASFATGGSVSYTGLAKVHGTQSQSETMFNASQSRDLWEMVRTGNFSSMVADRALEGVNSALKNPNINSTSDSRVININGMVIKADNPKQFHDQFMQEINKYWDVQIVDSPIR